MKILLSSSNAVVTAAVERAAESGPFELIRVPDIREAWSLLQQKDAPNIVLIDYAGTAGLTGMDLCTRFAELNPGRQCYFILLDPPLSVPLPPSDPEEPPHDLLRLPLTPEETAWHLRLAMITVLAWACNGNFALSENPTLLPRKTAMLRESNRELKCLYDISKYVDQSQTVNDILFNEILDSLTRSVTHTNLAVARLLFRDQVFQIPSNPDVPPRAFTSDIVADGRTIGSLQIGYLDDALPADPFTEDEKDLVRNLTDHIAKSVEQHDGREALALRLRYEETLAHCSKIMLTAELNDMQAIPTAIGLLQQAARVSRVSVFRNALSAGGDTVATLMYEAAAPGIPLLTDNFQVRLVQYSAGFEQWRETLSRGEVINGNTEAFTPQVQAVLREFGVTSVLAIPLTQQGAWVGTISFDETHGQRAWTPQDVRLLRTAAEMISAHMTQRLNITQLADLVHQRQELEEIIALSPIVAFLWQADSQWTVAYVSRNVRIFGYTPEDFAGRVRFTDIVHPDDVQRVADEVADYTRRDVDQFRQEYRILTPQGRIIWVDVRTQARRNDLGTVTHLQGVLIDISDRILAEEALRRRTADLTELNTKLRQEIDERHKIEQQRLQLEHDLQQSRRLESIGTLAAGIAHEINTPIQYIRDNFQFISKAAQDLLALVRHGAQKDAPVDLDFLDKEVPQAIQETLEGLVRVTKIVGAMKDFSHLGNVDEMAVSDLNKAIESTVTVTRNAWKYVSDLETDLDPALPPVRCYLHDLNQTVMNLIVNAAHAIEDAAKVRPGVKGKIRVSTRRENGSVVIAVADNGTGIPKEVRGKIFDPFFTTKAVGRGTGQGLTIAYTAVVQKHGGTLTFETEMGQGTTFFIRLPENPNPAAARSTPNAE